MDGQPVARTLPAVLAGDAEDRLASLFDAHHERLYRLARRLTSNPDDALDLVQETYLKAARYTKSIPMGLRNEEAWLVRVLINIRRDASGTEKMRASTADRIGKPLAFLIDGQVVMAPVLRTSIGESALVTGKMTRAESERIATGIGIH